MTLVAAGLVPVVVDVPSAGAVISPTEPRNVAAIGGPTTGNMKVTWQAPSNLGGAASVKYRVATAPDGGAFGAPVDVGTAKQKVLPCAGTTSCDFRVFAYNVAGTSPPSTTATGTWAVPGKPTIKTVTGGLDVGQMSMTLKAPASNGGKAITGYLYEVQVDSAGSWFGPFPVNTTSPKTVGCSSTTGSGGCKYRIYAVNSIGTSVVSTAVAGTWNVPKAPSMFLVKPGPAAGNATIEWRKPADTGGLALSFSYEISVDGGAFTAGTVSLPSFPYRASVPCPATNNCSYRVTASNAKGAGPASGAMSTAFNPPGAATGVNATVAVLADLNFGTGTPTATVTWGPPGNTGGLVITGYEGRQCDGNCDETNTAAWASATVVSLGNTNTWRPTCPAGQVTCTFQVRPVNALGSGPWGTAARMTPFAVTDVQAATVAPAGSVGVTWTGPAEVGSGIDHIALYRCFTTAGCGNAANWADTGVVITGNPGYAVDNCGQAVSCTYRVVAVGTGAAGSSTSSATAAGSGSTLPDAPSGLVATSHTSTIGAVNLSWTAPSTSGTYPVTDYVFQRSVNGGPFSSAISTGSTSTSYTDTGCGGYNSCTYQVAAVTLAGTGSYSNTATAEGANVPTAPQNLTASEGVALGAVDLAWQAPLDNGGNAVTGYLVERSLDGGSTWPTSSTIGNVLSYTDAACGEGVACTYRVSAINSVGTGPATGAVTQTGTAVKPPTGLTATTSVANGSFNPSTSNLGGVDLSWTASISSGVTGYEFRYSTNGGGTYSAWSDVAGLLGSSGSLATSGTHICTATNTATTCTYQVRALIGTSASGPSNTDSAAALIDTVAPAVTVTTPADNAAAPSSTPTLSGAAGTAVGDSTTVNVTVKQGVTIIRTFTVTAVAGTWTVNGTDWAAGSPASLADGTYTVTATQVDWAANTGTSNVRTFTNDNAAPTTVVTSPHAGDLIASSGTTYTSPTEVAWGSGGCTSTTICGTASDGGSGVANVKVTVQAVNTANAGNNGKYWDGSSFASASSVDLSASGTTSWSLTFPVTNFPAGGSYTITARATDNAGNVATATSVTVYIDYNPADTVFVASGGAGTGLTPGSPLGSIATALTTAQSNSRTRVVVAGGSYGATSLTGLSPAPASKVTTGGYSSSTWLRAAPGTNTATISGAGTALLVNAYTLTFQQLTITGTNSGLGAGSSVYGVRATGSANVTLSRVVVSAQAGVAGSGGGTGGNGSTGCTGANGVTFNGSQGGSCGGSGNAAGGTGGGGGGGGSFFSSGGNGAAGGAGGGGAAGGGGGNGGYCVSPSPGNGGGGSGGGSGTTGSAGAGAGNGTTNAGDTWAGLTGGTGGTGGNGSGGGGGGGGGGTYCAGAATGGRGAGGGGGGTAATGGTTGSYGGGSFAVYANAATITVNTSSSLTAAAGGAGGAGGGGGTGGAGGPGGQGQGQNKGGNSGSGGGGAGAGGGGGGGGGTGGPSIAAFHKGSGTLTVDGTTTSTRATTAASGGNGGSGGSGGSSGAGGVYNSNGESGGGNNGAAGATGNGGTTGQAGTSGLLCVKYDGTTCTP